ncbi:alkaline phosphatase family protein [Ruania alba]|uniref:Type I phosphodiesterase / nucleotide pyrophosphatase n=1 Tax=Ruania alba TaxID=648782 RepID=A0A1H5FJM0_9MICO|nr:nucleotide pyrophosphatase/phosphodiesterase family protein [Ruania alba]SEE03521.1 Type I phosphodiesterase / nucleotide pyrophosphatase [Ruania alba]
MSLDGTAGRLGDVLLGAVGACGIDLPGGAEAEAARARLALPRSRKACVVLVDGLGAYNLVDRASRAPFLSGEERLRSVRTTFPSTTATNVTYLGTGREGGRTRMLGYTVRGGGGGLLNLVSWNGTADPEQWQPEATVFERLERAGHVAVSVGPWRFADSGLTRAALRGGEYSPAQSLPERVDTALRELRDPHVDVVYLYWGELDAIGHRAGWQCAEWSDELEAIDTELARLARMLPPGTLLMVTADHGMVDVPATERTDIAEDDRLRRDVDLVAGEPRAVHLYTRPGRADQVAARWREVLGDSVDVRARAELLTSGLIGDVTPQARDVVGDVVVIARGRHAVVDSRSQSASSLALIGMHGALTAEETTVPLVTVAG